MPDYAQAGRLISLDATPLGPDVLLLDAFSGREGLSELFEYRLDLLSPDQAIKAQDIVGQPVVFSLRRADGTRRPFSGFVRRFVGGPLHIQGLRRYHAEVVPWLWFLTRTSDCRIFQEKTVAQIAEEIFGELGFSDFDTAALQESHPARQYCVQYRETDFDFLSRLMEEEGIFYWFTHEDSGKHILHLADTTNAYAPCPQKEIELTEGSRSVDYLDSWRHTYEFRSGKWAQTDYCFEKPGADLKTTEETVVPIPSAKSFEQFDWPGRYHDKDHGGELTRVRMEEEEWPFSVVEATSASRGLLIGHKFTLTRHFDAGEKGEYVITRVVHEASNGSYVAGLGGSEDFGMTFACIPAATVFRPPRRTPKPRIHGLQTAVCVGRPGEEIDTDKYGRIKCQFFWDRRGKSDDKSSCWIRVAHSVAGKKWGTLDLPRIGHEVVVAFEEGDPDRPVVIGSVFNDWTMPPYTLPDHKTKWTTKTMSSKGGGGFNELRFEDKKGEEQVFLHAEKDIDLRVKNDRREWIGRDRHLVVNRDKVEQVERDLHASLKRDRVVEVARDDHLNVVGKQAIKITGSHSLVVQGAVTEEFKASHSETVTGALYLKGMNVVIEGATGLTIKVGGSHVTINPGGVFIVGPMVSINSGGAPLSGSPGSAVPPAAPLEALLADNADPGELVGTFKQQLAEAPPAKLASLNAPWHPGTPDADNKKTSWIEIELVDEEDNPVPGERYEITLPDGTTIASGTLDEKGFARVDGIDPGECKITFPDLDRDAWERS